MTTRTRILRDVEAAVEAILDLQAQGSTRAHTWDYITRLRAAVAAAQVAALPAAPPTCGACGLADWHVSSTDAKRRTLHVACSGAGQEGLR